MDWQISLSDRKDALRIAPGQQAELRDKADGRVLFTAIAPPQDTGNLAFVFTESLGVSTGGKPIICPVVVVDRRGLNLVVKRGGTLLQLRAEPVSDVSAGTRGKCPLCRMIIEREAVARRCVWCAKTYHLECILGETKCPVCGRAFPDR